MSVTYSTYTGPVGRLHLMFDNGRLFKIVMKRPRIFHEVEISDEWKKKLDSYFYGEEVDFGVDMPRYGTEFQHRVWERLMKIPQGDYVTYGDLAKELQTHPMAIGAACRANPLPIMIPCHRVVYSNGELGSYMGQKNLENMKRQLLKIENCPIVQEDAVQG